MALLGFGAILGLWYVLSLVYPPLIVPGPAAVFGRLVQIVRGPDFVEVVALTLGRLAWGLALGAAPALAVGILCGGSRGLENFFRPGIGSIQAVPPVAWLAMALIWFGFNGRASVFIVALATFPVVAIATTEGVRAMDGRLAEVCAAYRFPPLKRLRLFVFPSLAPFLRSAAKTALGNGWKTVVMGEVLTTSTGIGGKLTDARLNIEPESVLAWALVAAALFFLMDGAWETGARIIRRLRGKAGAPARRRS